MKKLYVLLIATIIAGCSDNREVTIETSPMGSEFIYKNRQFTTPAKLELPLEGDIVLNQEGYKPYTISNESFGNSDYLKVELDKLPKFKVDIEVGNVKYYKVFIDNRKVSSSSVTLNEGEYNIRITADGYEPFTTNLKVTKDERLSIDMTRPQKEYTIKIFRRI